ncbi:hypothetical protein [Microbispora triticiradicis]|uniref:hypothetical protein n=1 Tax=Microbispora triticiradicis TaxID=2200763 RepID=UPI001AD6A2E9|nr:hypothetical protein [Microbispora triticiradicis]MBO4275166.1 hypothetical protein [Microbispora triticiradicis]
MGLFSSKMTDAELAKAKGKGLSASHLNRLARQALGDGTNRAGQQQAAAELARTVGRRAAGRLKEDALRQAGARAKGLGRVFG